MSDFWTSTPGPAGYGVFSSPLEWVLENEVEASHVKVLDIGSADGDGFRGLVQSLEDSSDKSFETFALEPQSIVYDDFSNERSDHPVRGMAGGEEYGIPFKQDSFDIVVSNFLLPFLDSEEQSRALNQIEDVLDPQGVAALHLRPEEGSDSERWVLRYEDFQETMYDSDNFSEYPLEVDRSDNLHHSDSRGRLPEGFYDEFREKYE